MALSFTSNKKASQIISDSSGYRGPLDYVLNMDVPNDDYFALGHNGERTPRALETVITATRDSSNARVFDEDMNISTIPANTPRRTYLPHAQTYGVLVEEPRFNFFDQTAPIVSKVTNTLPTTTNFFACFALGGTAQVSAAEVNIIKGTGSYEDPMFFQLKDGGTVTPMVTVSSGVRAVQVEQLIYKNTASVVPSRSGSLKGKETLQWGDNMNTPSGTIVFRVVENARSVEPPLDLEFIPYVHLMHDADNYLAMNRRMIDNVFTLRLFKEGAQLMVSQHALMSRNNTVALSWNNGVISFAVNGIAYDVPGTMSPTFKPNTITFLTEIASWVQVAGNGALTNMIAYNRSLSLEELAKATTSWN